MLRTSYEYVVSASFKGDYATEIGRFPIFSMARECMMKNKHRCEKETGYIKILLFEYDERGIVVRTNEIAETRNLDW